jgi:hypothetical protein
MHARHSLDKPSRLDLFFENWSVGRDDLHLLHRYTNRKTDDASRFAHVMSSVTGKRLTWRELCEVDGCGFMGLE